MVINGFKLNDELIMEIGKFTILWNCFERYQCQNLCNPTKIKSISSSLNIKKEEMLELANVLNKRRSWFGQVIPDYVETGLHPGNARMSRAEELHLMEDFMEQKSDDMRCGCLLVIHRIRNNLMHGLKRIEQLNDQLELFQAVNGVLESVDFAK
ncbi:MAG: hypothetical protein U0M42_00855 [Acutalibacteraceae bacterium]|nr:hypothetical protein [Acutalibacteraceae bacterium]